MAALEGHPDGRHVIVLTAGSAVQQHCGERQRGVMALHGVSANASFCLSEIVSRRSKAAQAA